MVKKFCHIPNIRSLGKIFVTPQKGTKWKKHRGNLLTKVRAESDLKNGACCYLSINSLWPLRCLRYHITSALGLLRSSIDLLCFACCRTNIDSVLSWSSHTWMSLQRTPTSDEKFCQVDSLHRDYCMFQHIYLRVVFADHKFWPCLQPKLLAADMCHGALAQVFFVFKSSRVFAWMLIHAVSPNVKNFARIYFPINVACNEFEIP